MAGNANSGRRQEKFWRDALWLEGNRIDELSGKKKLALAAKKLFDAALEGDVSALKEIGDRIDGKPAQEQFVDITEHKTVIRSPAPESSTQEWMNRNSTKSSGNPNAAPKLNS